MPITNGSPIVEHCTVQQLLGHGRQRRQRLRRRRATHPDGYDGGWAGGAYGGAVYCGSPSNPTFTDCQFENCFAQGGNGGNGGDARRCGAGATTTPPHGGRGGNWTGSPSEETGPLSHVRTGRGGMAGNGGLYDPVTGQPYAGTQPPY